MKILSFFILSLLAFVNTKAQSVLPLRADEVVIEKIGGNSNLRIRNSTRDSAGGVLYNIGAGLTAFKKTRSINDTAFIIGGDTVVIRGGAQALTNASGPGDTLKIDNTIKRVDHDATIISTPSATNIRFGADTSNYIASKHYVDSLANLEDSSVVINIGDGEGVSFVRNDTLFFKKISITGSATVTTLPDSTLQINVPDQTPTLTATQVAYGGPSNEMTSEPSFNYTAATNALHSDSMLTIRTRSDSVFVNHRFGVGTTAPQFTTHMVSAGANVGIVNSNAMSSIGGAALLLYNAGNPTTSGLRLGQFLFGSNPTGTTFRNSAAVAAYSDGAWTDGSSHPTNIAFEITQAGSSSRIEVARFKSTGQLGIGTTAPHMRLTLAGAFSSPTQTGVEAYQYGGALGGVFIGLSSRGTESAPTATQANDTIARFGGAGYGVSQSAPYSTGTMQVLAEENFTNTSMPTGMLFQTTPTGSNVRLNRMYIRANGNVSIGTTSAIANIAARKLYINGSTGIPKDSLPIVTTTGSDYALVIDTADDQIKRRYRPKTYTAIISQSGTSNPVATVLQPNSIGTIVWTRNSAGNYTGTLTGAFPVSKTWLVVSSSSLGFPTATLTRVDNDSITLITYNESGGVLIADDDFDFMSIEIRIYQ